MSATVLLLTADAKLPTISKLKTARPQTELAAVLIEDEVASTGVFPCSALALLPSRGPVNVVPGAPGLLPRIDSKTIGTSTVLDARLYMVL